MNFYPHHIGDYKSATTHLTNEEDLTYRRLLEMYYDTEQLIPLDTQWVSRRLRVGKTLVETILNDFFFMEENGYSHARCNYEIAEFHRKGDIARANGKKGGRRKATPIIENNPSGKQPVSEANPTLTKPLAIQYPVSSIQEPINTTPDGFIDFWKTWIPNDRKGGKGKCLEFWIKNKLEKQKDEILAHVKKMNLSQQWTESGGKFIPAPSSYLNQRKWDGAEIETQGVGVKYT